MTNGRAGKSSLTFIGFVLAATGGAGDLMAQEVARTPAMNGQAFRDQWQFTLGGGVLSRPLYPGSDRTKTQPLPIFSATYGRYFFGSLPGSGIPAGLGAYLYQDEHWRLGVAVGAELISPRKEGDDPRLRGLGDIKGTERASVFAAYTYNWLNLRGMVSQDIGGKHEGTLATLDLRARYKPTDALTLSAGPGVTWADSKYTQTFFGVDPTQSAASGLPQFTAKSGVNSLRFSVGADYRLTPQWNLGAQFTAGTLRGDAAHSPITVDKTQNVFSVFGSYRF
jgi:outer membrane protein